MTWASVVWTWSRDRQDADRLIRLEVSRLCGVAADVVGLTWMCPKCGSAAHGRPLVAPWTGRSAPPSVSLSRSGDMVAVVLASELSVGIDLEAVDSFANLRLTAVLLHEDERAEGPGELATTWVRKEALLKAAGWGLSMDPRRVRLSGPQDAPAVLEWPDGPWGAQPAWLIDLRLDPGVRAALAGFGVAPDEVTVRQVGPAAPAG